MILPWRFFRSDMVSLAVSMLRFKLFDVLIRDEPKVPSKPFGHDDPTRYPEEEKFARGGSRGGMLFGSSI